MPPVLRMIVCIQKGHWLPKFTAWFCVRSVGTHSRGCWSNVCVCALLLYHDINDLILFLTLFCPLSIFLYATFFYVVFIFRAPMISREISELLVKMAHKLYSYLFNFQTHNLPLFPFSKKGTFLIVEIIVGTCLCDPWNRIQS